MMHDAVSEAIINFSLVFIFIKIGKTIEWKIIIIEIKISIIIC